MKSFYKTCLAVLCGFVMQQAVAYHDMFMSYVGPKDVEAITQYVNDQKLGGLILWTIAGDTPFDTSAGSSSLLGAAYRTIDASQNQPLVMAYWPNWSPASTNRAIPSKPYLVPGSDGGVNQNEDFSHKLAGMNAIAYAFLEAQTDKAQVWVQISANEGRFVTINNPNPAKQGTLYFSDPWADLAPNDPNCSWDNQICSYIPTLQKLAKQQNGVDAPTDIDAYLKGGNFTAFAALPSVPNNKLGALKKYISVGGYAHDDSFEVTFGNAQYRDNFVNSAKKLLTDYNIDGIDLDYENPNMSQAQSQEFLALVTKLSETLGESKSITVTILSSDQYLKGEKDGNIGFAPDVLKQIAVLPNVRTINLMTYDFHGAFDYTPDGKGTTGFLTNLYPPEHAPASYQFSVQASVQAALDQGVPANKIVVGIPAYSRALAGISSANGGLFAPIPNTATIPQGQLDPKDCDMNLPLNANSCSGTFEYQYVVNQMIGSGSDKFQETQQYASGVANGTTAYATNWAVPVASNPTLTIQDASQSFGIVVNIYDADGTELFNSGWIGQGSTHTFNPDSYGSSSTAKIDGQTGLLVKWQLGADPLKACDSGALDFTKPAKLVINPETGRCQIQSVSGQ